VSDFESIDAIGDALKKCSASLTELRRGRWQFHLHNGKPMAVSAEVREGWLRLTTRVRAGDPYGPESFWSLLRLNAELSPFVKLALGSRAAGLHLQADIPVDPEIGFEGHVRHACIGLETGMRAVHVGVKKSVPIPSSSGPSPVETRLLDLCREAGWGGRERSQGSVVVDLETGGEFYQATLTESPSAGLHAWVELARCGISRSSRAALGVLLLTAGGLVRMARPAVDENLEPASTRFEVRLPPTSGSSELDHGLSALSIACRLCGSEARALQDEALARQYLAVRGFSRTADQEQGHPSARNQGGPNHG